MDSRRRFFRLLSAAIVSLFMIVTAAASPALAITTGYDHMESLDARYEIRADGSVRVTTTISWELSVTEKLPATVTYALPVAAPWVLDRSQQAQFAIEDLAIADRQGKPAPVQVLRNPDPITPHQLLVIGDQASSRKWNTSHTYTISYVVKGAIGSKPNASVLWWELAPKAGIPISRVHAVVTAPGGVTSLQCSSPCVDAPVEGGRELHVDNLHAARGLTMTAQLAELPGIEPVLVAQQSITPQGLDQEAVATVSHAGDMDIVSSATIIPGSAASANRLVISHPLRLPYAGGQDLQPQYGDAYISVEGANPAPMPSVVEGDYRRWVYDFSDRSREPFRVTVHQHIAGVGGVAGAGSNGARVVLQPRPLLSSQWQDAAYRVVLPGSDVGLPQCQHLTHGRASDCRTYSWEWDKGEILITGYPDSLDDYLVVATHAEQLSVAAPVTVRSTLKTQSLFGMVVILGYLVATVAAVAVGWQVMRRKPTRLRWKGYGPGQKPSGTADPGIELDRVASSAIAGSSAAPEAGLVEAACVMPRRPVGAAIAAVIAQMLEKGQLVLGERPGDILPGAVPAQTRLETALQEGSPSSRIVVDELHQAMDTVRAGEGFTARGSAVALLSRPWRDKVLWVLAGCAGLSAALSLVVLSPLSGRPAAWLGCAMFWCGLLLLAIETLVLPADCLGPNGTATHDDVVALERYLREEGLPALSTGTALERHYAELLPWAVLLDCAEHWSARCARAGLDLETLKISTAPGGVSWSTFVDELERKLPEST